MVYLSKNKNTFLFHFDSDSYFKLSQDQRKSRSNLIGKFLIIREIFTASELKRLDAANKDIKTNARKWMSRVCVKNLNV